MKLFDKAMKNLHRSLKENEQEIRKLEKQNKLPKVSKQSRFREKLTAIAGLLMILLAIAGIVFGTIFFHHVKLHKQEAAYQEKIAYYTDFIAPAVLFDTGEFVSPSNANNLSLLIPSFFKAQEAAYAGKEERESVVNETTGTRYILREEEVQIAARTLFGQDVICQTFSLDGLTFEYVENEKYFLSPITLRIAMYTPEIAGMVVTETGVELIVNYVEIAAPDQHLVAKTMRFTLQGEYQHEIITGITAADIISPTDVK